MICKWWQRWKAREKKDARRRHEQTKLIIDAIGEEHGGAPTREDM